MDNLHRVAPPGRYACSVRLRNPDLIFADCDPMTQKQKETIDWKRVQAAAGPYPIEAFSFVREGLSYTADQLHENPAPRGELTERDCHISGQQLCMGLRDFAIERYGLLAPVVMEHWNVRRTDDF